MSLKLLVAGDFHAREDLLEGCREEIQENDYDLYVNLGDYMEKDYAERLFEGLDVAAIGTTGNRDLHLSEDDLEGMPVYHFLEADIDDEYKLVLIGGDFPEDVQERFEEMIEDVDSDKLIVGSHYPPKKVGDKIDTGRRIGFEQFRKMIMRHKPVLWMNGHVHEDFGERELMKTKVLNAASYDSDKAYSVEIEDGEVDVEEIDLLE
jgi:Icc-related predicted phosphoesterase